MSHLTAPQLFLLPEPLPWAASLLFLKPSDQLSPLHTHI